MPIDHSMNFLAHLYLSGESADIQIGNFIGDYVKGSHYLHYRESVKEGILLHRAIDHYTDNSPWVSLSKTYFKPVYGRYSGIVCDLLYDHFLAQEWTSYSIHSLRDFTARIHKTLMRNYLVLPIRVQQFIPFLIRNKRLESYATAEGLHKAMEIMAKYTSLPPFQDEAMQIVSKHRPEIVEHFRQFMKEVVHFVEQEKGIRIYKPDNAHLL